MKRKKLLGLFLTVFALVACTVGLSASARAEDTVYYISRAWDDTNKVVTEETLDTSEYTELTTQTTWGTEDNWYVLKEDKNISNAITVSGTVNLILCDGAKLTASAGITVASGNTLNIYAQSEGTGALTATGSYQSAGIGGGNGGAGGTVTVHGGIVTATGGTNAAGIGGGYYGAGGIVTVYGGTVTATGGDRGAGIGGGRYGNGGEVTVYGGTVTATGGDRGAGIGGGRTGNGGEVTVYGGTVTANGYNSAGIGGGQNGAGGTVAIYGGTVTATGGDSESMGIGHGNGGSGDGTLTLGAGVTLYGGTTQNPTTELASAAGAYTGDRFQYMRTEYTATPSTYTVTLTGGANATADGATEQSVNVDCAMETVTFTPDDGYHFDSFVAITGNGVTAEFDEGSVVVSGTPTGDATLTIPDAVEDAPKFTSHRMVLTSEIGLQFRVAFPDSFDAEGCYVNFVVSDGRNFDVQYEDAQSVPNSATDKYFNCPLNPLELADTVTATLHYGAGQEKTNTYSAMTYFNAARGLNTPVLTNLVSSLQDLGHYIGATEWTDNNTPHAAIAAMSTPSVDTATAGVSAKDVTCDNGNLADVKVSLTLTENTVINLYVKPAADVTITNYKGTKTIDGETYYLIQSDKFGPKLLGTDQNIIVETSAGNTTVSVSAMAYVNKGLSAESNMKDAEKTALAAFYNYFVAAYAYE